eukprot:5098410-Pleurochrysis_carterae.AAC.3
MSSKAFQPLPSHGQPTYPFPNSKHETHANKRVQRALLPMRAPAHTGKRACGSGHKRPTHARARVHSRAASER